MIPATMARTLVPFGAALALAAPALAEKACFLSYATFEEKVGHADIDTCPGLDVTPEEGFCRIALLGHEVMIYLFRHGDPEPCLTRVDRYTANEFFARFGPVYEKP
jgi:hypothetical protein